MYSILRSLTKSVFTAAAISLLACNAAEATDWTSWRGPLQTGESLEHFKNAKIAEIIAAMHADGTLTELSMKWYGVDLTTVQ